MARLPAIRAGEASAISGEERLQGIHGGLLARGHHDAVRTLRHPEVLARPTNRDGVFTFDLARDGRE
jgi:hypothetical protein